MKKVVYKIITILITLIFIKIVIGLAPMCPSRYYTEKTFKGLVKQAENNNTSSLENLILYCNNNYDTVEEKKHNLKLLRCYTHELAWYTNMKVFFSKNKYLKAYSKKECPKEPLKSLDGHYAIWKYTLDAFIFNSLPR